MLLAQQRSRSRLPVALAPTNVGRPRLIGGYLRRSKPVVHASWFREWVFGADLSEIKTSLKQVKETLEEVKASQGSMQQSQERTETGLKAGKASQGSMQQTLSSQGDSLEAVNKTLTSQGESLETVNKTLTSHGKVLGLLGEEVMLKKMPGQWPATLRGAFDLAGTVGSPKSDIQDLAKQLCQGALRLAVVLAFLELMLAQLRREKQAGGDIIGAEKLDQAIAGFRLAHAPHLDTNLSFDSTAPAARVTVDLVQLMQDFTALQQVQQQPGTRTWYAPYVNRVFRFKAAMGKALSKGDAQHVLDELSKQDSIFMPLIAAAAASELRMEVEIDGLGKVISTSDGPELGLSEIKAINTDVHEACTRLEVSMTVLDAAWQWSGNSGSGALILRGTVLLPKGGVDGEGDAQSAQYDVQRRLRERSPSMHILVE